MQGIFKKSSPIVLLTYFVIALGVSFRIIEYFINRSLWWDEASLAQNILDRSYIGLLDPLAGKQVAPILFLWAEKFFLQIFQLPEKGLRFFPLISSIVSIPLMYYVTQKMIRNKVVVLLSLVLFCFSPLLVYYASEIKQYSVDVFCCLLIWAVILKYVSSNAKSILALCFTGVLLIWFSNISILVLFPGYLFLAAKYKSNRKVMQRLAVSLILCIISFGAYYYNFVLDHPLQKVMRFDWQPQFMPLNFFTRNFYKWQIEHIYIILNRVMAFPRYSILFFVLGCCFAIGLINSLNLKKINVILFFSSVAVFLHLFLSAAHIYPFFIRFILYLIPAFIILASSGVEWIMNKFPLYNRSAIILVLLLCLIYPVTLIRSFPIYHEEIKKTLAYLDANKKRSDKVYVYYRSSRSVSFYNKTGYFVIDSSNLVYGSFFEKKEQGTVSEINALKSPVWVILDHYGSSSHIPDNGSFNQNIQPYEDDPEAIILNLLKASGRTIGKQFHTVGSSVYYIE